MPTQTINLVTHIDKKEKKKQNGQQKLWTLPLELASRIDYY